MGIANCGIDVGLKSHAICLLDESQKSVKKYTIVNDIEGFEKLEADLNKETKICLEPTGVHSINIFLYFRNRGYDIKFCRTDSSHNFRQAMFRNKKHDRFDAFALAKYRIVNEQQTFDGHTIIEKMGMDNHLYNQNHQELSTLLTQYLSIKRRTQVLKTQIKVLIDLRFPEAIQIFPGDRGCKAIRQVLLHSKDDILSGKIAVKRLKEIQDKLKQSIGQYDMKRLEFTECITELDTLENKADELEQRMKSVLQESGYAFLFDFQCLNTIGITILINTIKDIARFYRYNEDGSFNKKRSLKAFKKFLGLTVTSNQSGTREGGHKLAKTGNAPIRNILFLMAMRYVQADIKKLEAKNSDLSPDKFSLFYKQLLARGVKKMVALTKVMNKISTDLFFILKNHADSKLNQL